MNKSSFRSTKTRGTALVGLLASILLMSLLVMPASRASAASTLLSLGKPAVASSLQQGSSYYTALKVTDGDLTTRWSSEKIDPSWVYVDLGTSSTIDRVVINWWGEYATSYQIQVSDDATNWTSIYSTSTGDGVIDDVAVSGSGRYVRMYGTVRSYSNGHYSINEMEIYGSNGAGGPTATNTTVPPTATNTSTGPTATKTNTPTGPTATNTMVPPTATRTNTPTGPTATPSSGFIENWNASTSAYFGLSAGGKSTITSNFADAAGTDGKVLQMKLAARPRVGAGNGPEIQSPVRYQYGSFSTRLKAADCSGQPLAGVVTGYFTYFDDGTDYDGDGIPDNSEIDFEWLCAQPQVMFITVWTDYGASPDVHEKTYRELDLSTGTIIKTCHDHVWGECQALTSSELQPTSITAIPGYNSSTAYYEYGFTWTSTGIRWWVVNPANGTQITLWDYQGPASRIAQLPSNYMTNVWYTNNWSPETMPTAIQQPTIPIYAYVDWTKYTNP